MKKPKKPSVKQVHALFLEKMDDMLVHACGAEKKLESEKCEWREVVYTYTVQTKYGPLVLKPDVPINLEAKEGKPLKRDRYWLTCWGKFEDGERAKVLTNWVANGKWNFYFSQAKEYTDRMEEIDDLVTYILDRLNLILV